MFTKTIINMNNYKKIVATIRFAVVVAVALIVIPIVITFVKRSRNTNIKTNGNNGNDNNNRRDAISRRGRRNNSYDCRDGIINAKNKLRINNNIIMNDDN